MITPKKEFELMILYKLKINPAQTEFLNTLDKWKGQNFEKSKKRTKSTVDNSRNLELREEQKNKEKNHMPPLSPWLFNKLVLCYKKIYPPRQILNKKNIFYSIKTDLWKSKVNKWQIINI